MNFIKNSFSPENRFVNSDNEIYERYARSKEDLDVTKEQCKPKPDPLKQRMRERRKKETIKKQMKRYLDYTNSQMPFNEGMKSSKITQVCIRAKVLVFEGRRGN